MELVAGVDEAGRGPLAGPVVAAAVILPGKHTIEGLKDSKKLSKKKREILFKIIHDQAISIGIGISEVKTIDKINIREATFIAMQMALGRLYPKPDRALIDGHPLNNQIIPNEGIIGGDNIVDSIKAASIIAKVTRDKIMKEYSVIFPEYGFEKHSGYGTKIHLEALDVFKATPIHRSTFRPVKERMPTLTWLINNNRVGWMGDKLAALFIKNRGLEIVEIKKDCLPHEQINIIAMENNQKVLIKVLTVIENKKPIILNDISKEKTKELNRSLKTLSNNFIYNDNCRFDFILIVLQKNNQPNIQYLKDIKSE